MSTLFSDLNLRPELAQHVAELGYTEPTAIQSALIPALLSGRDAIGQALTGTGKTAAFALPMLQRLEATDGTVQGLVLTPTRELAMQVASAIYNYGRPLNVRALPIYGGQPYRRQVDRIRKGVDVIVGTPGRLLDLIRQGHLDLSQVRTAVLDEADEMLSMGFVEDIEAILSATPTERQTALISATLPGGIRSLSSRYLNDPVMCAVGGEQRTVGRIEQRHYMVHYSDKLDAVTRLLEVEPVESAVVFARTRASTNELAADLSRRGHRAESLNGEMSQSARADVLHRFREKQVQVLVATDVAARGLDIDHITHVFNYDLPRDPEVYVHRVGRTGRAGKAGVAISLVTPRERKRLQAVSRYTRQDIPKVDVPSVADVQAHRDQQAAKQLAERLEKAPSPRLRSVIEQLITEGHDPVDLAAAALGLAQPEETPQPLAIERRPVRDRSHHAHQAGRGRPQRRNGSRSVKRSSHESGMVRLTLDSGRANGLKPNHVVGTIAATASIPGQAIGKIHIEHQHTLVDVPERYVEQVLAQQGGYRIGKHRISVQRA